jgi:hypothetical protein
MSADFVSVIVPVTVCIAVPVTLYRTLELPVVEGPVVLVLRTRVCKYGSEFRCEIVQHTVQTEKNDIHEGWG